jgi:hypothetical protein
MLLPLSCAAAFLLLPPLLAGRGGEGQGMGSGDAAGVRGSSVEAYGRDASRSSPLCSGMLPWGKRPELLLEGKPSSNKHCLPLSVCITPMFLLSADSGGEGEDNAFGVSTAPLCRRQVSVDSALGSDSLGSSSPLCYSDGPLRLAVADGSVVGGRPPPLSSSATALSGRQTRQVNLQGEAARSSNSTARVPTTSNAARQQLQGSSYSAPARRLAPVLVLKLMAGRQPLLARMREEEVLGTS